MEHFEMSHAFLNQKQTLKMGISKRALMNEYLQKKNLRITRLNLNIFKHFEKSVCHMTLFHTRSWVNLGELESFTNRPLNMNSCEIDKNKNKPFCDF